MNILEAVLNAQGGAAAREAGRTLGLSQEQTGAAFGALVPALAAGLQRNASQPGGLDSLIGALASGQHSRYLDDPASLGQPASITDGNAILGHILGTKDASRAVAALGLAPRFTSKAASTSNRAVEELGGPDSDSRTRAHRL